MSREALQRLQVFLVIMNVRNYCLGLLAVLLKKVCMLISDCKFRGLVSSDKFPNVDLNICF